MDSCLAAYPAGPWEAEKHSQACHPFDSYYSEAELIEIAARRAVEIPVPAVEIAVLPVAVAAAVVAVVETEEPAVVEIADRAVVGIDRVEVAAKIPESERVDLAEEVLPGDWRGVLLERGHRS